MSEISSPQVINMDDMRFEQPQNQQVEDELETFWQRGMCSRRSKLVEEASKKTGREIPEIKHWISKRKKKAQRAMDKENGVEPKRREKTPLRRKRGYDLFMSERLNQEDLKSFGVERRSEKLSLAQRDWRELPEDEKEEWNKKAEALPITVEGPTQIESKVSKLEAKCIELWAMGSSVTLLIPDDTGSFRIHAPPETKPFWTENEDAPVLQAYADELRTSRTTAAPKNADRLRREIQNLFNLRYEEATGKKKPCNYIQMDAGQIVAHGMPEGIEFKRPGMYNMLEKRAILQRAGEIRFEVSNPQVLIVQMPVDVEVNNDVQNIEGAINQSVSLDEDGNVNSGDPVQPINVRETPVTEGGMMDGESPMVADSVVSPTDSEIVTFHDLEIVNVSLEGPGTVHQIGMEESTLAGPYNSDDEVTDLSSSTAEEAMKRAEFLAKQWESEKNLPKKKLSARKSYMSGLVGKRIKQLWTLKDRRKSAKWFQGTIIQSSDGTYNIKYDGEEELHPLTAAKTKQLLKKKTLCFI